MPFLAAEVEKDTIAGFEAPKPTSILAYTFLALTPNWPHNEVVSALPRHWSCWRIRHPTVLCPMVISLNAHLGQSLVLARRSLERDTRK